MSHSTTMRIAGEDRKTMARRIGFTVAALNAAACPPGKNRVWVYDTRQSGLCLMITGTGAKSFYVYRKVNNRPQRIRLAGFPEITIEQARNQAKRHIGDIAKGADPMALKRTARAQGMNVGQLFEWFLEHWAKPRKRSWHDDELRYNGHLKPWAKKQLTEVKLEDVSALHRSVAKATSNATANRVLALLSTMFNKARQIGFTGTNPCKGVEKFAEESRERFVSAEELPRLMLAIESTATDADWQDYFKLLLLTGARRGNALAMRWSEVDFDTAQWNIPSEKSKNKKSMPVALASHALDILRKRKRKGEWVFPGDGASGHLMNPDPAWKDICTRAQLTDVRIHDLRRTFGSWQAAAGVSLAIIGKTLGHRSTAATQIYSRMNLDPVRASVNSVTAALMATAVQPMAEEEDNSRQGSD